MHFLNSSSVLLLRRELAACSDRAEAAPSAEPALLGRHLCSRLAESSLLLSLCFLTIVQEGCVSTRGPGRWGEGGRCHPSPPPSSLPPPHRPKSASPTQSLRSPHFLIFAHIKSEEILWQGEMEGREQSILARGGREV